PIDDTLTRGADYNFILGYSGHEGGVAPLPEQILIGQLFNWWGEFHVGQVFAFHDVPIQFAPGVNTSRRADGTVQAQVPSPVGFGAGWTNYWGIGFVPQEINIRKRTITTKEGDFVVSNDLIPYMRQRDVTVTGHLFPGNAPLSGTFAGRPIALRKMDGTPDVTSDAGGNFKCLFTVPLNVPCGTAAVVLSAPWVGRAESGPGTP